MSPEQVLHVISQHLLGPTPPLRCCDALQLVHFVGSVFVEHVVQVVSQLVHAVEFAKIYGNVQPVQTVELLHNEH